jgi:hypothetical protein
VPSEIAAKFISPSGVVAFSGFELRGYLGAGPLTGCVRQTEEE